MQKRNWRLAHPTGKKIDDYSLKIFREVINIPHDELTEFERKMKSLILSSYEIKLECLNCGSYFRPNRAEQLYCSDSCKSQIWYHRNRKKISPLKNKG